MSFCLLFVLPSFIVFFFVPVSFAWEHHKKNCSTILVWAQMWHEIHCLSGKKWESDGDDDDGDDDDNL